jgi:ribonuclease HI
VTTGLALKLTLAMLGMDDLAKSIAEFRVITTCETKLQPTQVGVLYLFNHTIWQTREDIKNTERRATGRTLAKEIWRTTITKLGRYSPTSVTNTVFPGNRLPSSRKRQIALRIKSFGAAGKRTEAQRAAAVKQVEETLAGLPANAVIAFTDGSSLGNPGPAGAGALITGQKQNISSKLSFYLGHHTNQGAELWAIGGVADFLEGKTSGEEVHIFSDSEFAINCVQRRWYSSKHFKLVEAVRKAISQLSAIVIFHQVAGHANIEGNDIADALAKKGADYSRVTHCAINTDTIIDNHNFLYLTVPNQ